MTKQATEQGHDKPQAARATAMTAIVCHAPKDYRVEKIARPVAGPRELVIRIGACGICASDCKCWTGAKMFWGGENVPSWVKAPGRFPGTSSSATSRTLGDGAAEHFGVARRRARDRRADRAVRALPLLPLGQVLDVRGPQHLRLPAGSRRRRHGAVHAHPVRPRSCTRSRRTCRSKTRRSSSRWPARSMPSPAATSSSMTSS